MLAPPVCNFPAPKVISVTKKNLDMDSVKKVIQMNNYYKSIIITCPDEIHTPANIKDFVTVDKDYYEVSACPLTVFLDNKFINNFVKRGNLFCFSNDTDCVTQNCVAITPEGVLIVHIPEYIYQCIGLEGTKQPLNYFDIRINLKELQKIGKIKQSLSKLEPFNFYMVWEPHSEDICPSSLAKYLYEQGLQVSVKSPLITIVTPTIAEIPSVKDVDPEDLEEWIGMLVHGGDLNPAYNYVSSYTQPESEDSIKSTRISVLVVKNFFTPNALCNLCDGLSKYVNSREMSNYWASISILSYGDTLWRWNYSNPSIFQAHDSSTNVFFTQDSNTVYSIGQIKFS